MALLLERLTNSLASSPVLIWVLISLLIYVLERNALWLARGKALEGTWYGTWLGQAARFLYYLGIPYLVLGGWPRTRYQGLLSLSDLGLVGLDAAWPVTRWLEAVGTALGLGLVALSLLLLAWANSQRFSAGARIGFSPRSWWQLVVDALYLQIHWAFYRGALAVALGDVYHGVFGGLGLVLLEWALDPFWRQDWRTPPRAGGPWLRVALALVAAPVFFLTRNLWLCLGVHLSLEFALRHMASRPAAAPAADQML